MAPKRSQAAAVSSSPRPKRKTRKTETKEYLREPPFRSICIKAAELEAYSRHTDSGRNEDKVQEDVRRSVEEEIRKHNQAKCASILARNTAMRLLGDNKTETKGVLKFKPEEDYGEEKTWLKLGVGLLNFVNNETKTLPEWPLKKSRTKDGCDQSMKMDKMSVVVKLTGVTIFTKVDGQGGNTIVGTLEAHVDGFIYTTSTSYYHSQLTLKYENVKEVFFQGEDNKKMLSDVEKLPPLLQFQLHHPIKVGTEKREHIQFRLVPTVVGERRPDNDSNKFEKEKQTTDSGRSKDLKDFVRKAGMKWWGSCPPFSFRRISKQGEFQGVLPTKKASEVFMLTFSSLLQLANTPFIVVNLGEIEIVHLARIRPEEVDMTVVFKNFNRPVLQIRSIPVDSLEEIKRTLDRWSVKFYDLNLNLDWDSIVKKIVENPETFIREGGWDGYKLEGSDSLLYYKHYYLELSQAAMEKKDLIWE
ncbi:hypothetical protein MKX03_021861 [Papaver bracteatum]|nr:hypothetical protein MKX03_021861 [Papaver bracteatum]